MFGRTLVQRHNIYLSREAYDASCSSMIMSIKPADEHLWTHFMDTPTQKVIPL